MNKKIGLDDGKIVEQYMKDGVLHIHLEFPILGDLATFPESSIPSAADVLTILDEMGFEKFYEVKRGSQYTRVNSFRIKHSMFVIYEQKDGISLGISAFDFLGNTDAFSFLHYLKPHLSEDQRKVTEVTDRYLVFYSNASRLPLLINEINSYIAQDVDVKYLTYSQECNAFSHFFNADPQEKDQFLCPVHFPKVEIEKNWGNSFSKMWLGMEESMGEDMPPNILKQETKRQCITLQCSENIQAYREYQKWIFCNENFIDDSEQLPLEEILTKYPLYDYTPLLKRLIKENLFIYGSKDNRFPHIVKFKFASKADLKQFFLDIEGHLRLLF